MPPSISTRSSPSTSAITAALRSRTTGSQYRAGAQGEARGHGNRRTKPVAASRAIIQVA